MASLTSSLTEFRRTLATEQGTEAPCPFCGVPRVRRSVYIRCNPCGTNWLDEERHLPDYLNIDPRVARDHVRMASSVARPVGTSTEAANS